MKHIIKNPYNINNTEYFVKRNWIEEVDVFLKSIDDLPLVLVGGTGIGKTQVIKTLATNMGMKVYPFILSQMNDIGDFLGFAVNTKQGVRMEFLPQWQEIFTLNLNFYKKITENPSYIPKQNEKCVIFLDEYNRAPADILYSVFSLLSEYSIKNFQLFPQITRIIGSINPVGDFSVSQDDPAFKSRVSYLPAEADFDSWIKWLKEKDAKGELIYGTEMVEFLSSLTDKQRKIIFAKEYVSIDYDGEPSPRSWARLMNAIYHRKGVSEELAIGTIGKEAVNQFKAYLKTIKKGKKINLTELGENDIISSLKTGGKNE